MIRLKLRGPSSFFAIVKFAVRIETLTANGENMAKTRYDACIDCGATKTGGSRRYSRCSICSQRNPERRNSVSNKIKERWQDKSYRDNVCDRISTVKRKRYEDDEFRERMKKIVKATMNTDETRIRCSLSHGGDGDLERINEAKRRLAWRKSARRLWTLSVKRRDGFKCAHCSSTIKLHAHHVKPKAQHPDYEFDIDNGITLCESCHLDEHRRLRSQ
jgi:5-methylcytosine-specific restriction endonuclease McrA